MLDMPLPPSNRPLPKLKLYYSDQETTWSLESGDWIPVPAFAITPGIASVVRGLTTLFAKPDIGLMMTLPEYKADIMWRLQEVIGRGSTADGYSVANGIMSKLEAMAKSCVMWVYPRNGTDMYGLTPDHEWIKLPYNDAMLVNQRSKTGEYFIVYYSGEVTGSVDKLFDTFLTIFNRR